MGLDNSGYIYYCISGVYMHISLMNHNQDEELCAISVIALYMLFDRSKAAFDPHGLCVKNIMRPGRVDWSLSDLVSRN